MLRCKEISELVSRSLDQKLPFWTRMGVRTHLMMCRFCSGFRRQILFFRRAARDDTDATGRTADPHARLSDQARERIKLTLQNPDS